MKIYLENHNQVANGLEEYFDIVDFDEAEKVVLWQDVMGVGKGLAKFAHLKKKPVIQILHGRRGYTQYGHPWDKEMLSDKICVWGKTDLDNLTRLGIPPEKIVITGTTLFSHLKPRIKHKGTNIVFSPDHWDTDIAENDQVVEVLRKMKGVNVTTKIMEIHDIKKYDNPIVSHRDRPNHLDICADALKEADLLVAISEGTFEMMAQILNIPVVIANLFTPRPCNGDTKYIDWRLPFSEAVKKEPDIKKLESVIRQQLKNPNELMEQRRSAALNDAGIEIKDPLQRIVGVIETTKYEKRRKKRG